MRHGVIDLFRERAHHPVGFGWFRAEYGALPNLLHPEEQAFAQRATSTVDTPRVGGFALEQAPPLRYRAGRVAAKHALSALFPAVDSSGIYIDRGVFGFPVVKSPALHNVQVSITHCSSVAPPNAPVALALAYPEEHPVGVDLERIHPDRIAANESLLTPSERILIDSLSLNRPAGLTLLWTIKEALSKVLRCGLVVNWSLLAPEDLRPAEDGWRGSFENFGQYQSQSWITGEWVCSIVLPARTTAHWKEFPTSLSFA